MKRSKRVKLTTREPLSLFRERYAEGGQIACGGMGEVVAITDKYLERELALKRLSPVHRGDIIPELRQRLREEAKIMAQLDHPGIVPVHEVALDDQGRLCFTMKLVAGEPLSGKIAAPLPQSRMVAGRRHRLDRVLAAQHRIRELVRYVLQVCDALSYAHDHGVIHRDLKPDNVLIGNYGEVYVMDWGIAKLASERAIDRPIPEIDTGGAYPFIEEQGRIFGTFGYLAPEQATADYDKIDVRTDVFGVGAILYTIVAHRPPFLGDSLYSSLERSRLAQPSLPLVEVPHLPGHLREIIETALQPKRQRRYQSMREIKQELESFLNCGWAFEQLRFKRGSVIIREGTPAKRAFIVVDGTCSVYRVDGRKLKHQRDLRPGDVFGETGIFAGHLRTARVKAKTNVVVTALSREDLDRDLKDGSLISLFVRALANRFIEKDNRVAELERELARLRRKQNRSSAAVAEAMQDR